MSSGSGTPQAIPLSATTLRLMSRPLDSWTLPREASIPRLLTASTLAVLLAAGAHLAARGTVTPTAEVVLAATTLMGSSTWLVREIGRRTRGLSASAAPVVAGQGVLELVLWSCGQGVRDPLLAAGLHAGAGLVLLVLVLGPDRVATDLRAVADRALPALCWSRRPNLAAGHEPIEIIGLAEPADPRGWPALHPVRGPPIPLPTLRLFAAIGSHHRTGPELHSACPEAPPSARPELARAATPFLKENDGGLVTTLRAARCRCPAGGRP